MGKRDSSERRFTIEGRPSIREARRYVYGVLVTALERDISQHDGLVLGGLGQADERLARKVVAKLIQDFKRKAGT